MTEDDRVQCVRCGNFRACRCFEPLAAGISHRRDPLEIGRTLADYTVQTTIYAIGWCVGFMDAAKHRDPLPGAGGPRVHEAPQGIFRG